MIKAAFTIAICTLLNTYITAQCSSVSAQISSSDTSFIQLYNAGIFNIPSGNANICEWYVTDFSENLIHEDVTSGDFEEQSFSSFNHNIPITDSMKVNIIIFNNIEGSVCNINDTLYWKETEVIPGSFVGNWDVLSSNGGVEDFEVSPTESNIIDLSINIAPSPTSDYLSIEGALDKYSLHIINSAGQVIDRHMDILNYEKIDVMHLSSGLYFISIIDDQERLIHIKKIIKL